MSNPFFRFKQFTVFHDKCAMKVGTDGVLLGAWASVEGVSNILDVGTGTGLIALMLAQRNMGAKVVAVDVNGMAVAQARENIRNSPFSDRIAVELGDFGQFVEKCRRKFDRIVSNPPFFSSSLLPPDSARAGARHSVSLTLDDLLLSTRNILKSDGTLSLILPYDRKEELILLCEKHGFHSKRETVVYPLPEVPPKRLLVELALCRVEEPVMDVLAIEVWRHVYTEEFAALVNDFYL